MNERVTPTKAAGGAAKHTSGDTPAVGKLPAAFAIVQYGQDADPALLAGRFGVLRGGALVAHFNTKAAAKHYVEQHTHAQVPSR
jgi:hypothetical protein